jgi:hypothetical protein
MFSIHDALDVVATQSTSPSWQHGSGRMHAACRKATGASVSQTNHVLSKIYNIKGKHKKYYIH